MNIFKLILFTLSAGLLYTNTSLMHRVRDVNGWLFAFLILFALTYSVISSLTLHELRSRFLTGCFAALDGVGIYMDFAGDCTNKQIGLYFGIYTALFSVAIYLLKGNTDSGKGNTDKALVEGHDAEYWHRCFLYQKERAEGLVIQSAPEPETKPRQTTAIVEEPHQTEEQPLQIAPQPRPKALTQTTALLTDEETEMLKSLNKSFNRMKDEDKRRAKIQALPSENLRAVACEIYKISL